MSDSRKGPLRVLVAIHSGGFNGIETYAEQVAIAGAAVGLDVTLLASSAHGAGELRSRLEGSRVTVLDAGLEEPSKNVVLAERLWPSLMTRRLASAIRRALGHSASRYDVVHVNRAALAPSLRPFGARLCVAGWFYPHAPAQRAIETLRHTRGNVPRRAVLAAKSVGFYLGDEEGYRASDCVVACTEVLAAQLRGQGINAVECPPPVRVLGDGSHEGRASTRSPNLVELLVCSGDLSHPRKNLRSAVLALPHLLELKPGREIVLYAIGRTPEALVDAAKSLPPGARLELLGPKAPREVHKKMREVDAFLFPSLYEEWGYVAVESLLSGTPVVAYPVYPFADMLGGGFGIVAEGSPNDPAAFARAIERALAGETRSDLASAAAARFGSAAVGERLASIWRNGDASDAAPPNGASRG